MTPLFCRKHFVTQPPIYNLRRLLLDNTLPIYMYRKYANFVQELLHATWVN